MFGLSPYLAVHLLGHFDLVAAWVLPLFALALRRAVRGSDAAALGAGLVLAITAYTTYYYVVYEGFFHDPLKTDLEAFLVSSQRKVSGEVVLETQGGTVSAVAVRSPHILNAKGATYAQSADWGVAEAEGFIKLYGMSSSLWAEVNR